MSYNIQSFVRGKFASVAAMLAAAPSLAIGEEVETTSYYDGWAATVQGAVGGNKYIKVEGQTPTEDGGSIIYTSDGNHLKATFPNGVWVEQFGAKTDGTDAYSAIIKATNYLKSQVTDSGNLGATLNLGQGTFESSQSWVVPPQISVKGQGRDLTCVKRGSTFTGSYVIQGGDSEIVYNSIIEKLTIDCNDTSTLGYYSNRINELSGLRDVLVVKFTGTGVRVVHGGALEAQNYLLQDLELLISDQSNGSAVGLDIEGNGTDTRGVDGITVNRVGNTSAGDTAILADGLRSAVLSRLNLEGVGIGLHIGSRQTCVGNVVQGVNGNANVTDLIRISNNNEVDSLVIQGVASSGSTNAIVDEINDNTITRNRVGWYCIGEDNVFNSDNRALTNVNYKTRTVDTAIIGDIRSSLNICSIAISGVTAGSTAYINVEVDSTSAGNINISCKTTVMCVANVRHVEDKQQGFALTTAGAVTDVVEGTQTGTSGQETNGITIDTPVALAVPEANKFRIPVTNNTAFTTAFTISLQLAIQGGNIVKVT